MVFLTFDWIIRRSEVEWVLWTNVRVALTVFEREPMVWWADKRAVTHAFVGSVTHFVSVGAFVWNFAHVTDACAFRVNSGEEVLVEAIKFTNSAVTNFLANSFTLEGIAERCNLLNWTSALAFRVDTLDKERSIALFRASLALTCLRIDTFE